jgi:hypothetical protein
MTIRPISIWNRELKIGNRELPFPVKPLEQLANGGLGTGHAVGFSIQYSGNQCCEHTEGVTFRVER